ncbi:MAG: inositol monophosphatase [Lentisphaerae bacterium]|nr:inositol monophosphatase [Lentisphaerota bacterium]
MLEFITELAESAGKESLEYFGKITENDIEGKATSKDLVSIADKAIENLIITKITERFPDHDIFGEETGHAGKNSPYCWVIDPIDGTQSFVKFHPYYSISIALYKDGKPFAGAVNAPALNRMFTACSGRGAFLNGKPIQVSGCTILEEAACATGFARLRENKVEPVLEKFNRILPRLRDIKRCGSAALDLAMTAAGVFDGYWEEGLQLYDVAAGAIIAREAGAVVCDYNGKENFPADGIIAGTPAIARALLAELNGK